MACEWSRGTALALAKDGIYSVDAIKDYTTNYQLSGG